MAGFSTSLMIEMIVDIPYEDYNGCGGVSYLFFCRYSLTYLKYLLLFFYSSLRTVFMCVILWRLEICKECSSSFCVWIIWISASMIYAC